MSKEKELKWGTIIPLIGGSAIGCNKATGNLPAFHLSYEAFAANESHIEDYWPDVPMYRLDHEELEIPPVVDPPIRIIKPKKSA